MTSATFLLGRELRAARRYRKLTQQFLADRAKVDLATVANLEAGRGTVATLLATLAALQYRFSGQSNDLDLGTWMKQRRLSAGLSQEQLCELTKLTRPSIAQIERGRGNIASLVAILSALRVKAALRPDEDAPNQISLRSVVRSPLRYPGGKFRTLKQLAYYFPSEIEEYREPFCGGASVAFYISEQFPEASIWINDLYGPVVTFWQVLQDPVKAITLVNRLQDLKANHTNEVAARNLFHRMQEQVQKVGGDEVDQAAAFYITNRCSFSGLTQSGSFSGEALRTRWTQKHIERLSDLTPLIQNWRISNLDYRSVLGADWSERAGFAFLDPPYPLMGNGLYGRRGSTHNGFDHETLRRSAEVIVVPTMITYGSNKGHQKLYAGWQQIVYDLDYSMNSHARYRRHQRARQELLLMNY